MSAVASLKEKFDGLVNILMPPEETYIDEEVQEEVWEETEQSTIMDAFISLPARW